MYGDRDWGCNWIGGERAVLSVEYSGAEDFRKAGYEPVVYGSNNTIGGQVKQYGNYSFARVYQAGHEGEIRPPVCTASRNTLTSGSAILPT